ncbi:MAG: hypothetical protein AVDCRST_MAG11-2085 [uncultured Gemmatimonadaceae bacterium]|uniref:Uncharacterized protein n=1 Tax=uncultured Gemmatimonadaceae bacterium TaxID=246130 RepID=A0A6J4L4M5_9BACT|nr:MAG: hypothetical protein AVDCRST_MAG11-2085 [uncultured Gemmatimonadaceae bacterium]
MRRTLRGCAPHAARARHTCARLTRLAPRAERGSYFARSTASL